MEDSEPDSKMMKLDERVPDCNQPSDSSTSRPSQASVSCSSHKEVTAEESHFSNLTRQGNYDSGFLIQDIEANEPSPDHLKEFDQVIINFMKEQKIPGASLALWRKGEMLYTQCYGKANQREKLRPFHRFRIASVTKSVTAAAIMKLVETKKIKLHQLVFGPKGILPHFTPMAGGDRRILKISVKHLLQHSGGWDREMVGDCVFWRHIGQVLGVPEPVQPKQIIKYMMSQKLQFTPGSRYAYSNFGYLVLGRVIETVTMKSYEEYIKEMLSAVDISGVELGLTKIHQAKENEVEYFSSPKHQAVDSVYPDEGKVPGPYGGYAMESGDSDGGLISTPTNMVKFFNSLENYALLQPKSFKAMLDKPVYARGHTAWYGFGLDVTWLRKAWEHSGTLDGATSCLVRNNNGYTWCFLCNYWPEDSDYTSLVSYALTCVKPYNIIKKILLPPADVATLDKKYVVKIKIPQCDFEYFHDVFVQMGYRISWLDGYQVLGQTYFNGIWTSDGEYVIFKYDLSQEQCDECIENMSRSNKHTLSHIDSYLYESSVKYSLIFVEDEEGLLWKAKTKLSLEELDKETGRLKLEGYNITHQCAVHSDIGLRVTALFRKEGQTVWAVDEMNLEQYQKEFAKHSRHGRMLTYIKPYVTSLEVSNEEQSEVKVNELCRDRISSALQTCKVTSRQEAIEEDIHSNCFREREPQNDPVIKFSAIWSMPGPYRFVAENEMSKFRLINDLMFVATKKFYPLCIAGYEDEGSHRFAAVLVKKYP